jgi:hypothetical protein
MINLSADIKRLLNALASSDAGEYLSLSDKHGFLNRDAAIPPSPAVEPVYKSNARKRIALFLGSELPADIISYVVQTCTRLQHDLVILTFQSEDEAQLLVSPYIDVLANAKIEMQLEVLTGDAVTGLARYLRRHSGIAFLACNEAGYLGRGLLSGVQRFEAFPIPVVLVASRLGKSARVDVQDTSEVAAKSVHVA